MIYVDSQRHMVSDESDQKLHFFAKTLGCNYTQFKRGKIHRYSLTIDQLNTARIYGAIHVSTKELITLATPTRTDVDTSGVRLYDSEVSK